MRHPLAVEIEKELKDYNVIINIIPGYFPGDIANSLGSLLKDVLGAQNDHFKSVAEKLLKLVEESLVEESKEMVDPVSAIPPSRKKKSDRSF